MAAFSSATRALRARLSDGGRRNTLLWSWNRTGTTVVPASREPADDLGEVGGDAGGVEVRAQGVVHPGHEQRDIGPVRDGGGHLLGEHAAHPRPGEGGVEVATDVDPERGGDQRADAPPAPAPGQGIAEPDGGGVAEHDQPPGPLERPHGGTRARARDGSGGRVRG